MQCLDFAGTWAMSRWLDKIPFQACFQSMAINIKASVNNQSIKGMQIQSLHNEVRGAAL